MQKNRSIKKTIDFIEVNGVGTASKAAGGTMDVLVYGYFKYDRYWFMVTQDFKNKERVSITEASTGGKLSKKLSFATVEEALEFALPYLKEKRIKLPTMIGNYLVRLKRNLSYRNVNNLSTLAINSTLWNL